MWSPVGDGLEASRLLGKTSAVLVTHAHSDHFHLPTLLHFPSDILIVIPRADQTSPMPMRDELLRLGFDNVQELAHNGQITIGDLTVIAIESPVSIEGIAQISYLVTDGTNRILHTADTLEGILTEEIPSNLYGVDLALLPMNASLNVANLRNQMSPATFATAAVRLGARRVVPLGTNECQRRAPSPTAAPWFPYGDAHLRSPGFKSITSKVPLVVLRDGESLTVGTRPRRQIAAARAQASDTSDSPEVDHLVGRLLTLLVDVNRRGRIAFGLAVDLPFDQWRDRWCDVVDTLDKRVTSANTRVDDYVGRVPVTDSISPAARIYRRSLDRSERRNPGTHARALWGIDRDTTERDFAQTVYELLVREADDDQSRWTVLLEYLAFLQRQHHTTRPRPPAGWTQELQQTWWKRQIREDLRAADHLYPRFNPIFGPFRHDDRLIFVSAEPEKGWHLISCRVPDSLTSAVTVIAAADGRESLQQLVDSGRIGRYEYQQLAAWLVALEPYALDGHWLQGASWGWSPMFDKQVTIP
jgi:L-ascorbate metabolism protein UlaG (beta-lactamase superfamily)